MRLVTFGADGEAARPGIAIDDRVVDLAAGAAALQGNPVDSLVTLLQQGEAGLALARRVEAAAIAGDLPARPEADVQLRAAIPRPPTIYLLAGNYQSHITESGAVPVRKEAITPRPFIKPATSVIGTGDAIEIPPDSDTVDYEIEIAAVIGNGGRQIPEAEADGHVAGYLVFNDLSARQLKIADKREGREGDWFFDWLLGKWCDSFAAVGPYLVTRDEIGDPRDLEMSLRVNGDLRQHSAAGEMIFTVSETIAFLSRFVTLQPGDLLCMGTPGGVGDTTATYLRAGDLVEAEIERLGRLVNPVT